MNVGFKLEESETSNWFFVACRPADGLWIMVSARFFDPLHDVFVSGSCLHYNLRRNSLDLGFY